MIKKKNKDFSVKYLSCLLLLFLDSHFNNVFAIFKRKRMKIHLAKQKKIEVCRTSFEMLRKNVLPIYHFFRNILFFFTIFILRISGRMPDIQKPKSFHMRKIYA